MVTFRFDRSSLEIISFKIDRPKLDIKYAKYVELMEKFILSVRKKCHEKIIFYYKNARKYATAFFKFALLFTVSIILLFTMLAQNFEYTVKPGAEIFYRGLYAGCYNDGTRIICCRKTSLFYGGLFDFRELYQMKRIYIDNNLPDNPQKDQCGQVENWVYQNQIMINAFAEVSKIKSEDFFCKVVCYGAFLLTMGAFTCMILEFIELFGILTSPISHLFYFFSFFFMFALFQLLVVKVVIIPTVTRIINEELKKIIHKIIPNFVMRLLTQKQKADLEKIAFPGADDWTPGNACFLGIASMVLMLLANIVAILNIINYIKSYKIIYIEND